MTLAYQTNEAKVASARRYGKKLTWKRVQCQSLAEYIKDFFETIGIELPIYKPKSLKFVDKSDEEMTDVYQNHADLTKLYQGNEELAKLYYTLKNTGKTLYAKFDKEGQKSEVVALATFWSRHRFDPAWLWRKSQILRKRFKEKIVSNQKLRDGYTPCHLTLTVPHKNGLFMGKEFYMKEIMGMFKELRRSDSWQEMVIGGEYNIEIKRSPNDNGLHIHIHSLLFLDNKISVHKLREFIYNRWAKFLGYPSLTKIQKAYLRWQKWNEKTTEKAKIKAEELRLEYEALKSLRLQIDLSTVYYYEKADNKYVMEPYQVHNKLTGQNEDRVRRKKIYYDKATWTDEQYSSAIMEVLKYQCKMDNVENKGVWDVLLIKEILNESKGGRFHSCFGKLYKNLINEKPEETAPQPSTDAEPQPDDANTDLGKVNIDGLINPFTNEQAQFGEYRFAVARPENLSFGKDGQLMSTNDRNYKFAPDTFTLKEAIEMIFPESYLLAKLKKARKERALTQV